MTNHVVSVALPAGLASRGPLLLPRRLLLVRSVAFLDLARRAFPGR
jgi:hypothetical protein